MREVRERKESESEASKAGRSVPAPLKKRPKNSKRPFFRLGRGPGWFFGQRRGRLPRFHRRVATENRFDHSCRGAKQGRRGERRERRSSSPKNSSERVSRLLVLCRGCMPQRALDLASWLPDVSINAPNSRRWKRRALQDCIEQAILAQDGRPHRARTVFGDASQPRRLRFITHASERAAQREKSDGTPLSFPGWVAGAGSQGRAGTRRASRPGR